MHEECASVSVAAFGTIGILD